MKISLALGPRRPLDRQTAWGCLTTNLALPGFGSLVAGRLWGYPQLLLGLAGLSLTLIFGLRFILWSLSHWSELHDATDPLGALERMWQVGFWAFAGIVIFLVGWVWALATSLNILRGAQQNPPQSEPPRLG